MRRAAAGRCLRAGIAVLLALVAAACTGRHGSRTGAPEPLPFGVEPCAVCGMFVREQPAPRAEVAWAGGGHRSLCSIADLRAFLAAPGPRGEPDATWVEALPPGFDPAAPPGPQLPWMPADQASYVVGFERPLTMGRPALSFPDRDMAVAAARRLGGHVVGWAELRSTRLDRDPPRAAQGGRMSEAPSLRPSSRTP